jgi:tetratricopeptide (TPR) repeat protein
MSNHAAEIDPFAPGILDQETELAALAHALEFASGFSLLFVRCNQAPQRRRLMAEARARLPHFTVQEIHFNEPVNHLLDALRERLAEPLPDAVFVSGLEHSLPDLASAPTTPFIANLNASRNSFPQIVPRPLVLWAPEYVLAAIARGAPDFFSIRSGVYAFAAAPDELAEFAHTLSAGEHWQAESLPLAEKRDRTAAIERLLAEYETLPVGQRDRRAELRLLDRLGVLLYVQGNYAEALRQFQRALKLAEELGDRAGVARSLRQLGLLHQARGEYSEAQQRYEQSLRIKEEFGSRAGVASTLHQLGMLHQDRGEYGEAQQRYEQSLRIEEELGNRAGVASTLHQLGMLHQDRGEYGEAQQRYDRSLQIKEGLGDRAGIVNSLYQLGTLHQARGEYGEALQRYEQSLRIAEELGNRAVVASLLGQIGKLFTETGQYEEAFNLLLNALATFRQLQSPNAGTAVNNLRTLRAQWGEQAFDATWRAGSGGDVPEWLRESSGAGS